MEQANAKAADLLAQYEAGLDEARQLQVQRCGVSWPGGKEALAAENRLSKKIAKQTAEADEAIRQAVSDAQMSSAKVRPFLPRPLWRVWRTCANRCQISGESERLRCLSNSSPLAAVISSVLIRSS